MKPVISSHLAKYRKLKGMTQDELADLSGVTSRTIQRIENGQVMPQMHTLKLLAKHLDIEPEKIMGITKTGTSDLPQQAPQGILAAMHILPLIGIFIPLLNILTSAAFWLLKKDQEEIFDQQGRIILNFQITITIVAALSIITMVLYFPVGFPLLMACYLIAILSAAYNMIRVLKRKNIYYPLIVRFLKIK
ncbi:MAG: helix-turn-helix domain-containing protein [Sphingobacteriaceae bacterium]|nr:helix-turn-helix domain-containing protein [Sphingobacteriaceae bacterium]